MLSNLPERKQFCKICFKSGGWQDQNKAILRDLVLKKKSGTTKFCETSSIFENIDSSEAVVFLPFSPPNMLRATAACTV